MVGILKILNMTKSVAALVLIWSHTDKQKCTLSHWTSSAQLAVPTVVVDKPTAICTCSPFVLDDTADIQTSINHTLAFLYAFYMCFFSNPWAPGRPTICCHISTWLRRPSKNALVAVASYKGAKTFAALICPRTFLSVHFTYLHILFLFPCFFWEMSKRSVMINKTLTWSMIANYSSIERGLILEKLRNYPMMGKGLIAPLKKASDQVEKWDQVHLTCFQYYNHQQSSSSHQLSCQATQALITIMWNGFQNAVGSKQGWTIYQHRHLTAMDARPLEVTDFSDEERNLC